jgi:hypothetical protein
VTVFRPSTVELLRGSYDDDGLVSIAQAFVPEPPVAPATGEGAPGYEGIEEVTHPMGSFTVPLPRSWARSFRGGSMDAESPEGSALFVTTTSTVDLRTTYGDLEQAVGREAAAGCRQTAGDLLHGDVRGYQTTMRCGATAVVVAGVRGDGPRSLLFVYRVADPRDVAMVARIVEEADLLRTG